MSNEIGPKPIEHPKVINTLCTPTLNPEINPRFKQDWRCNFTCHNFMGRYGMSVTLRLPDLVTLWFDSLPCEKTGFPCWSQALGHGWGVASWRVATQLTTSVTLMDFRCELISKRLRYKKHVDKAPIESGPRPPSVDTLARGVAN